MACSAAGPSHVRAAGTAVPHSATVCQALGGGAGAVGTARVLPLSNSVLVSMRLSLRQALLERASWTPEAQNAHVHVHGRPSLHSSFQVFRATLVTCEQRAIILTQPMASSSTNRRQSAPDLSLLIKMPRCFKGCSQHRMSYERSLKKTPTFRRSRHGSF